jgi:hypothetical protein
MTKTKRTPLDRRMDLYFFTSFLSFLATVPLVIYLPFASNAELVTQIVAGLLVVGSMTLALWLKTAPTCPRKNSKDVANMS